MRLPILLALFALSAAAPVLADDGACRAHLERVHPAGDPGERTQAMAAEIVAYQSLAEEALSLRAQAIRFYATLQERLAAGGHLTGADLRTLNEGAATMLSQRAALMEVAEAHECWLNAPATDAREAALQVAGIAMSLSAALLLYDNYLTAVLPYRNDHVLRQHFNRQDSGFELRAGTLNKIALSFASGENRQRVRRAIVWYEQYGRNTDLSGIEGAAYLRGLLDQSPSLALLRRVSPLRDLAGHLDSIGALTVDSLFGLHSEGTNLSSLLFGNAVGLVETRHGKLYQRPEVVERVKETLQAGDILVEKTPFRLTDTFIPGHWGHAALWVGSEAELRELGLWEHPVIHPHQAAIRAGRGIVEALRSGVEMNSVEHFMNIDDLGVLRHETLSRQQRAEVILQALRQVGKPYDFNFDAQTTDRIFCSKLVYLAYGDLQWPTSRTMGRVTVSPDNIAARATGDGPLTVSLLYHDGQEVTEGRREFNEKLMRRTTLALDEKRQ